MAEYWRRTGTRKRIRVYGRTWEETNRALAKAIAEHERGDAPTDTRTLAEYLEYWLSAVAVRRVRANTLHQYGIAVRYHIIPALGTKKLAKLTAKDVRTWLDRHAGQCRCCTTGTDAKRSTGRQRCCAIGQCCRQVPSPRRLQYLHAVLTTALSHAVREDLIPATSPNRSRHPPDRRAVTSPSPCPRLTP
jgi:hypothetical protein